MPTVSKVAFFVHVIKKLLIPAILCYWIIQWYVYIATEKRRLYKSNPNATSALKEGGWSV
jgi:hypothetical protein